MSKKKMPAKIDLFRRLGDTEPHVGKPGETMSWANMGGATYVRSDLISEVEMMFINQYIKDTQND
jgi:hypothetical protein